MPYNTLFSKICLVTGANSGIGFNTALTMAKQNCKVLVLCRDKAKAQYARNRIIELSGNKSIICYWSDLSDRNEINNISNQIKCDFNKIDVIIHNAACVSSKFELTKQSIELQFAVNHLAPFLLTHQLLPLLEKSKNARIISVTSRAHGRGTMHFDDLFLQKNYSISAAYNQSKLANLLFTYHLAKKLKGTTITVNAFHPGLVNSDIGSKNVSLFHDLVWRIIRLLGASPEKAAEDAVFLALSDDISQITGGYFHKKQQIHSSKDSYNKEWAERLWKISLELCGIKDELYGKIS